MLLVVLGHVLPINKIDFYNLATYDWIFSFHMPLFIFVSGYFTNIHDNRKFWRGIILLTESYLVFTILHICIMLIQGGSIGLDIFYVPRWTLWYLLSLIWWRFMIHFTPNGVRDKHLMLVFLSVVLCLVAGWIPLGKELSFQRTFYFLPFFVFGYVAKQRNTTLTINPLFAALVLLIVWMVFFVFQWNNIILLQQFDNMHYGPATRTFIIRVALLVLASCMSVCFLSIVPRKEKSWTRFGRDTLFIYMWHSVILSWRYNLRDFFNLPTTLPFCIIYAVVVLLIIYLLRKMTFFNWLLNPITSLTHK